MKYLTQIAEQVGYTDNEMKAAYMEFFNTSEHLSVMCRILDPQTASELQQKILESFRTHTEYGSRYRKQSAMIAFNENTE